MRQEHDRLAYLLEPLVTDLCQHDGKGNLQYCTECNEDDVVQNGIGGQRPYLAGGKEELKVLQSHKGAAEQSAAHIVLCECIIDANHRHIAENDEKCHAGDHHDQQSRVLAQIVEQI